MRAISLKSTVTNVDSNETTEEVWEFQLNPAGDIRVIHRQLKAKGSSQPLEYFEERNLKRSLTTRNVSEGIKERIELALSPAVSQVRFEETQ